MTTPFHVATHLGRLVLHGERRVGGRQYAVANVVRLQCLHHGVGFDVATDVADNHDGQLSDKGDPFLGVQLATAKTRNGLGDVGLGGGGGGAQA
jgi:hypothetical protein